MMTWLHLIPRILDTLGGARPLPERLARNSLVLILWGLWWLALFLIAIASSGQAVKFVYVDF